MAGDRKKELHEYMPENFSLVLFWPCGHQQVRFRCHKTLSIIRIKSNSLQSLVVSMLPSPNKQYLQITYSMKIQNLQINSIHRYCIFEKAKAFLQGNITHGKLCIQLFSLSIIQMILLTQTQIANYKVASELKY